MIWICSNSITANRALKNTIILISILHNEPHYPSTATGTNGHFGHDFGLAGTVRFPSARLPARPADATRPRERKDWRACWREDARIARERARERLKCSKSIQSQVQFLIL